MVKQEAGVRDKPEHTLAAQSPLKTWLAKFNPPIILRKSGAREAGLEVIQNRYNMHGQTIAERFAQVGVATRRAHKAVERNETTYNEGLGNQLRATRW